MSDVNAADELYKAITALLQAGGKSFTAGQVAQRLASVADDERFQYDPVARNIEAAVVKAASSNPGQLITAQQINQLYNELESLNPASEFKSAHSDLFPASAVAAPEAASVPRSLDLARHDYMDLDQVPGEEQINVGELDEPTPEYQHPEFAIGASFSPDQHRYAEFGTKQELESFGAHNVRLANKTNAPNLMVYTATFVTPTGKHAVLIPIQVADQPINLPQVFASIDGSRQYPFSQEGFKSFESDNMSLISVGALKAADSLRSDRTASEDGARTPSPLESYINEEETTSKVAGLEDVESVLLNASARKRSKYANRTIDAATELVTRELRAVGQHKPAIFAGDSENGDLSFKIDLVLNQRVASVSVPVEVRSGQVLFPTVFNSTAGKSYVLAKSGVEQFFNENHDVVKPLLKTEALATANFRTLRQVVYAACLAKDYDKASEALTVVATKFGNEALASITNDYQQWLSTPNLEASAHSFGTANKMSSDDWANAIQAELSTVANGNAPTKTGLEFNFEAHSNEGQEFMISTNRIDGLELT